MCEIGSSKLFTMAFDSLHSDTNVWLLPGEGLPGVSVWPEDSSTCSEPGFEPPTFFNLNLQLTLPTKPQLSILEPDN